MSVGDDMDNKLIRELQDKVGCTELKFNFGNIEKEFEFVENKDDELLNKEDIKKIFKCESDKSLKILKFMYTNNFGMKVGKEYYISKDNFKKFLEVYRGKDLKL